MTVLAWLLLSAALLALAYWVAAPLAQRWGSPATADGRLAELIARREELAALLRDVELDAADHRLPAEEQEALREQISLEGARVVAELQAVDE